MRRASPVRRASGPQKLRMGRGIMAFCALGVGSRKGGNSRSSGAPFALKSGTVNHHRAPFWKPWVHPGRLFGRPGLPRDAFGAGARFFSNSGAIQGRKPHPLGAHVGIKLAQCQEKLSKRARPDSDRKERHLRAWTDKVGYGFYTVTSICLARSKKMIFCPFWAHFPP